MFYSWSVGFQLLQRRLNERAALRLPTQSTGQALRLQDISSHDAAGVPKRIQGFLTKLLQAKACSPNSSCHSAQLKQVCEKTSSSPALTTVAPPSCHRHTAFRPQPQAGALRVSCARERGASGLRNSVTHESHPSLTSMPSSHVSPCSEQLKKKPTNRNSHLRGCCVSK